MAMETSGDQGLGGRRTEREKRTYERQRMGREDEEKERNREKGGREEEGEMREREREYRTMVLAPASRTRWLVAPVAITVV